MPPPTDEEYDRANRDFEFLLSEVLLVGTEAVGDEAAKVLEAFSRVGGQMRRFDGGRPHALAPPSANTTRVCHSPTEAMPWPLQRACSSGRCEPA
jgi:hypothetical protein